jgi:hypothetical protein
MKNFNSPARLFLILLLGYVKSINAQNEYFDGNPNWNLNIQGLGFGMNIDYSVYDDSIINGLDYLWIGPSHSFYDEPFFTTNGDISQCLVRSNGKEIFWRNPQTEEDELLYRFEGEIGDTLSIHPWLKYGPGQVPEIETSFFVIDEVDSMLIGDSYRKIYHSSEAWCANNSYIFEGIGSNAGPFTILTESQSKLNCFSWLEEVYVYEIFDQGIEYDKLVPGDCTIQSVTEKQKNELLIFPNPASSIITMQDINPSQISTFQITDMQSRIIVEFSASQCNEPIDISHLSNGCYLAKIIGLNGVITSSLIIKN